MTEVSIRFLFT